MQTVKFLRMLTEHLKQGQTSPVILDMYGVMIDFQLRGL